MSTEKELIGGVEVDQSINPQEWSLPHQPAINVQATVSKAAAVGVKHVARSISFCVGANAAPAGASSVAINLRDGATGAGTILWGLTIPIPAAVFSVTLGLPVNIAGSVGNAMTLEFAAAGGATVFESVSLTGYDSE